MAAPNYTKYLALEDYFRATMRHDDATGRVRWREDVSTAGVGGKSRKAGQAVGCITKDGYWQGCIKNNSVYMHIVAWFLVHGSWPDGQVDHINGDKTDNRMANLRVVSHAENIQNQRTANRRNAIGVLGVSKAGNRFRAHIRKSGVDYDLGSFDSVEAAHAAYVQAKREMHAGCTI